MRNTLLATVAAAALVAGTVAVSAQGMSPSGSPGGGPPSTAPPPSAAPAEKMDKGSPGAQKGAPAGERSTTGQGQGGQGQMDRGGPAQQPRTGQEGQPPRQDTQREGQQPRQDTQREGQQPRQDTQREGQQQPRAGQGQQQTGGSTSVSLTTEQKTKIRQTVLQSSNAPRVTNVNFDLKVGTAVPRERVKLVTVPGPIVEIHPQWRGFLYFIVNDEIIIVDPKTYEIVAVIEV